MAEKMFTDAKCVYGDDRSRAIYDSQDRAVFSYNPEEWQVDVVLTRRFTPGVYVKYKEGVMHKEWGIYSVVEAVKPADLPSLIQGFEWRRVTIGEVE